MKCPAHAQEINSVKKNLCKFLEGLAGIVGA